MIMNPIHGSTLNSKITKQFHKNYTIISNSSTISGFPDLKSWVIEGSLDNNNWKTLSEVKDSSILIGANIVYTFDIHNQQQIKFTQMRQIGKISYDTHDFYESLI